MRLLQQLLLLLLGSAASRGFHWTQASATKTLYIEHLSLPLLQLRYLVLSSQATAPSPADYADVAARLAFLQSLSCPADGKDVSTCASIQAQAAAYGAPLAAGQSIFGTVLHVN